MNLTTVMAIDTGALSDAGVNTLVGMGTVFIILIFISLIISCFTLISKIQNSMNNKQNNQDVVSSSINNTVAQLVSNEEEEMTDDFELVAVITASIMAYLGDEAPADGLVVRNIRKVR